MAGRMSGQSPRRIAFEPSTWLISTARSIHSWSMTQPSDRAVAMTGQSVGDRGRCLPSSGDWRLGVSPVFGPTT
jgi:hypothetical protein